MSIYLTGGGEQEVFRELDQHFLSHLPDASRILIVPTAAEEHEYEDVHERIESCFDHRSISCFDLCEDVDSITPEKLDSYQAIFVEGGNTFKIVNAVRRSHFFSLLEDYVNRGKTIYADSAGAIILGANVKTAFIGDEADEDSMKLQDYRGLDIISPWSIHCHYRPEEKDQIQDLIFETGSPVIALSEEAGALLADHQIHAMGTEPVDIYTFTGIHSLSPGQSLALNDLAS